MNDDDLRGQIVLVHPDIEFDPVGKSGEIGIVTAASLDEDVVRVRFEDDRRALFSLGAVLVFKGSDAINQLIDREAVNPEPTVFNYLKNIALLLHYGTSDQERTAMKIALKHDDVILNAMETLEESLGLNQKLKRGR
jgi:hypothetical protein